MHSGRWMSIFSHIYFFHWLTAELWAFQLPFFLKFSTRTFIFSPFVFHRNLDFFPKKILVEMKKIANHPPTSSFCQGNGDLNVWDFSMPGNDWKRWMWHQVRWWWPWLILASTFNMKISKATIGVGGLLELVGWLQRWWFGKMFRIFPGFLDIHLRCVSFFHTKKHRIGIIRYIYIYIPHPSWVVQMTLKHHVQHTSVGNDCFFVRSLEIDGLPEVVYGWMRVRLLEMALMMMAMATWYNWSKMRLKLNDDTLQNREKLI